MYIPKHFKINDVEAFTIIKENSFATLFSQHNGQPFATHLPLTLNKDHTYLYGHFARPNPQWKYMLNQTVLAVFPGPHCYISPSWYETNKAVPTWNYTAVHVYGEIEFIEDEDELIDSLHDMVLKYEAPDSSYRLQDVDSEFLAGMSPKCLIHGISSYISPSCLPVLGYTQQDFYKCSLYTYCHPSDRMERMPV